MKVLTVKEQETIQKHLDAFNSNFQEIEILKDGKNYFVFQNKNETFSNWKYTCNNIEHLNGWLYGAVQGINTLVRK